MESNSRKRIHLILQQWLCFQNSAAPIIIEAKDAKAIIEVPALCADDEGLNVGEYVKYSPLSVGLVVGGAVGDTGRRVGGRELVVIPPNAIPWAVVGLRLGGPVLGD